MKLENKKIEIYKNLLLNIPGLKQADYRKLLSHQLLQHGESIGPMIILLEIFCKTLEMLILKK